MVEQQKNESLAALRLHLRGQERLLLQQQQQQQESLLKPASLFLAEEGGVPLSSNGSTPPPTPANLSALPSTANLMGSKRPEGAPATRKLLLRQISADVRTSLPHVPREDCGETARKAAAALARLPLLLALLFVFICSLDLLSTAFRLLAGKAAGGRTY